MNENVDDQIKDPFFKVPKLVTSDKSVEEISEALVARNNFQDEILRRSRSCYEDAVKLAHSVVEAQGRGDNPKKHRTHTWYDPILGDQPYTAGRFLVRSKNYLQLYEPEPWVIRVDGMYSGLAFEEALDSERSMVEGLETPKVGLGLEFANQQLSSIDLRWNAQYPEAGWVFLYLSNLDQPDKNLNKFFEMLRSYQLPYRENYGDNDNNARYASRLRLALGENVGWSLEQHLGTEPTLQIPKDKSDEDNEGMSKPAIWAKKVASHIQVLFDGKVENRPRQINKRFGLGQTGLKHLEYNYSLVPEDGRFDLSILNREVEHEYDLFIRDKLYQLGLVPFRSDHFLWLFDSLLKVVPRESYDRPSVNKDS